MTRRRARKATWPAGGASRWWLHHSLARLDEELRTRGSRLILRAGRNTLSELEALARDCGATRVVWNRRYEPAAIARDRIIKAALGERGIEADSYNGSLLHEPWTVKTKSHGPFQVFTPFWRHCLAQEEPSQPLAAPARIPSPSRWPNFLAVAGARVASQDRLGGRLARHVATRQRRRAYAAATIPQRVFRRLRQLARSTGRDRHLAAVAVFALR